MPSHEPENDDLPHPMHKTLTALEGLDNIAHVVVAAFFILMAITVIVYSVATFAHQLPAIGEAFRGEAAGGEGKSVFMEHSLRLLSDILFVVIVLELLKTIITYLQTRDIHAIMKEFLVVGIISSVRKILLVGAESSLSGSTGWDFAKEAIGTVITIVGILLMIVGLVMLQRSQKGAETTTSEGARYSG